MTDKQTAWLNLVHEDPLEPDLPSCDAHHHLWDRPGNRYLIDDFARDASGHNVLSSVFVECMAGYREDGPDALKPVGETAFVDALADRWAASHPGAPAYCAAIISYADLRLGDGVEPVLEAHIGASPNRFRGIRHAVGWDSGPGVPISHTKPKEGLLLDKTFRTGCACLRKFDLLFETYLYHTQLGELADLARCLPDQPIVMNHIGGPLGVGPYTGRRAEVFEHWRRGIAELAACPNVVAKLGGAAMPRNGFGWHERPMPPNSEQLAETYSTYYRYCIDRFGPERCMFESNFPVEKVSCSYTVLWNAFKRIARVYSESEKASLFRTVATRVYRIATTD